MRLFYRVAGGLMILMAAFSVPAGAWSGRLYPEVSEGLFQGRYYLDSLEDFLAAGTGKTVDTKGVDAGEILNTAREFIGVPYCMGGKSTQCMDCSGLLVAVFAKHGISMPHNSEDLARYGKIVKDKDKLRKGDLVFFADSYTTTHFITHSGIYAGDNTFIHASSYYGVTVTSLEDPWWDEKFVFGTRIF